MKRVLTFALVLTCLAGCRSSPRVQVLEHRARLYNSESYSEFLNRRTTELQRMGGAFKDKKVAEQKARENADSLFGAPVPVARASSTSQSKSAQAELNEALDDLKRERTR